MGDFANDSNSVIMIKIEKRYSYNANRNGGVGFLFLAAGRHNFFCDDDFYFVFLCFISIFSKDEDAKKFFLTTSSIKLSNLNGIYI